MPRPTKKSALKGSPRRKSPRTNDKPLPATEPHIGIIAVPALPETRNWHDGFLMLTRQVARYRPVKPTLDAISDLQWEMADEVLRQGVVLGFIANPVEAVTAAVAVVERIALPLELYYDGDDGVLYFSQWDEKR